MSALWVHEHGEDYQDPKEVVLALRDVSWHNDVCPSFGPVPELVDPCGDVHDLRLWVDHPDPDQRESSAGHRYAVNYNCWSTILVAGIPRSEDRDIYAGEDLDEALAAFAEVAGVIASELRRRADKI